jgi:hypothetical protein
VDWATWVIGYTLVYVALSRNTTLSIAYNLVAYLSTLVTAIRTLTFIESNDS